MAHHYVVTIAAFIVAHHAHLAIKGRNDGVARIDLDVESLMYPLEGGTVTVTRSDIARRRGHAESTQVDDEAVGHLFTLIGMGAVGHPRIVNGTAIVVDLEVALYGTLYGD